MRFLIVKMQELEKVLQALPKQLESFSTLPYKVKRNIDGEEIITEVLLVYKEK